MVVPEPSRRMSWATVSSVWSWEWSALWEELVVEDTGVTIVDGVGRYAEQAITVTFMVALTLVPLDQSPYTYRSISQVHRPLSHSDPTLVLIVVTYKGDPVTEFLALLHLDAPHGSLPLEVTGLASTGCFQSQC